MFFWSVSKLFALMSLFAVLAAVSSKPSRLSRMNAVAKPPVSAPSRTLKQFKIKALPNRRAGPQPSALLSPLSLVMAPVLEAVGNTMPLLRNLLGKLNTVSTSNAFSDSISLPASSTQVSLEDVLSALDDLLTNPARFSLSASNFLSSLSNLINAILSSSAADSDTLNSILELVSQLLGPLEALVTELSQNSGTPVAPSLLSYLSSISTAITGGQASSADSNASGLVPSFSDIPSAAGVQSIIQSILDDITNDSSFSSVGLLSLLFELQTALQNTADELAQFSANNNGALVTLSSFVSGVNSILLNVLNAGSISTTTVSPTSDLVIALVRLLNEIATIPAVSSANNVAVSSSATSGSDSNVLAVAGVGGVLQLRHSDF